MFLCGPYSPRIHPTQVLKRPAAAYKNFGFDEAFAQVLEHEGKYKGPILANKINNFDKEII